MYNDNITEILKNTEDISELVIFSGKSGSGKTTIMDTIIEKYNGIELPNVYRPEWQEQTPTLNIRKAKKYTTREQRHNDDPTEFIYVTEEEFQSLVDEEMIAVEYTPDGAGGRYGWSERDLKPKDNEIIITPANDDSVAKDLKYLHNSTNIYIDVKEDILRKRIIARKGTEEETRSRLEKLTREHITKAYDISGIQHDIDMDSEFYGTYAELEGTAHLIIENNGDLDFTGEKIFSEILSLASDKRYMYYIPRQKKLSIQKQNNNNICVETILRKEDGLTPSGKSKILKQTFDKNRTDYDILVMLGVVTSPWTLHPSEYFIQISNISEEINIREERRFVFTGCIIKPIEHWAISKKNTTKNIIEDLINNGLSQRDVHSVGEFNEKPEIKAIYYEGNTPYRKIRDIFEKNNVQRII